MVQYNGRKDIEDRNSIIKKFNFVFPHLTYLNCLCVTNLEQPSNPIFFFIFYEAGTGKYKLSKYTAEEYYNGGMVHPATEIEWV